jgi:hypothetical protein
MWRGMGRFPLLAMTVCGFNAYQLQLPMPVPRRGARRAAPTGPLRSAASSRDRSTRTLSMHDLDQRPDGALEG